MKKNSVIGSIIILIILSAFISINAQTGKVFSKNEKLVSLFNDGVFTEAVTVSPEGKVYFSDITIPKLSNNQAGHLYTFDPVTNKVLLFRSPSGFTNGMTFDRKGDLYSVQNNVGYGFRNVLRTDMKTGKVYIVADNYEGKRFNAPNDIKISKKGNIYFTDPRYMDVGSIELPFFGVFLIDESNKVKPVITNLSAPNGLAISPDQKYLYISEHPLTSLDNLNYPGEFGHMKIIRYSLDAQGIPAFDKIFVDYGFIEGADGLTIDDEGNLYAAVRDEKRKGIYVYSAEGMDIDYLPLPEKPTNMAFGRGTDKNTLYITAGKSLYKITTLKKGDY